MTEKPKKDTSKYAEASRRKWQDPEFRARMSKAASLAQRKRFARPEERAKLRRHAHRKMLKQWQDPAYRAKMSLALSKPRPAQSVALKRKWKTNSYQRKIRKGRKRTWRRRAYRQAVSKMLKTYWAKSGTRANVSRKVLAAFQKKSVQRRHRRAIKKMMTLSYHKKLSKIRKALWKKPAYRADTVRKAAEGTRRPETRAKISAAAKRMWSDPVHAKRHAAAVVRNSHYAQYQYMDRHSRNWTFKSGDQWERGFAKWLDEQRLTWSYEPKVFYLSTGLRYTPDFWVRQWKCHVELKASHRDTLKAEQFRADGHKIIILQGLKEIQRFKENPVIPA